MNKFKLIKNNNSKKLIIGIAILFCNVILIIGVTTAFFTQSDSETTGNIATVDINKTLKYYDNNDYMRGNLIPVVEDDVIKFASKNELNKYTNEDICKYQDDMYACSLYQFTIENIADVTQKLIVTLNPYPNTFTNLHYLILEEEQLNLTSESKSLNRITFIEGLEPSQMLNEVIIKPKESKTYTVIFYIKAMGYDQTEEDANKNFGAIINVNSITTGYNIANIVGDSCYELEELPDKTYKLTKFNGINHETGEITEGCGFTKNEDTGLYSVEIPSKIGDYNISTLGNTLFSMVNTLEDGTVIGTNEFVNIEKITINEGITTLEDGIYNSNNNKGNGVFLGIGYDLVNESPNPERTLDVNLPNTLKYIGTLAFSATALREIEIPASVEIIGLGAFSFDSNLENLKFKKDQTGNSYLKEIGAGSFHKNNINSLTIPASVQTIGMTAFSLNNNLITLTFEEGSNLTTIGDSAFQKDNISSLKIPKSVVLIGKYAFDDNVNLATLNFVGADDGTSKLTSIGEYAFCNSNLYYPTEVNPLIIPPGVEFIGEHAFLGNKMDGSMDNFKFVQYKGTNLEVINNNPNGNRWYGYGVTLLTE